MLLSRLFLSALLALARAASRRRGRELYCERVSGRGLGGGHLGRVGKHEVVLEAHENILEDHFERLVQPRVALVCRVFSLGFWSQAFAELKARSGSSFVGVVVLAVETVAVVLAVELLAAASPKSGRKKEQ